MPLAAFPKCFLDRILIEKTMTPEEWVEMAGSLDVWAERGGPGSHEYAVPTRLSRPEAPGVWVSAG